MKKAWFLPILCLISFLAGTTTTARATGSTAQADNLATANAFISSLQRTNEILERTVANGNENLRQSRAELAAEKQKTNELRDMVDEFLADLEKVEQPDEAMVKKLYGVTFPKEVSKDPAKLQLVVRQYQSLLQQARWRLKSSLRDRRGPREFLGQSLQEFDQDRAKPVVLPPALYEGLPKARPDTPNG